MTGCRPMTAAEVRAMLTRRRRAMTTLEAAR
jgi:hypothetical protein